MFIAVSFEVALFLIPYQLGTLLYDPVSWNESVAVKWIASSGLHGIKCTRKIPGYTGFFLW